MRYCVFSYNNIWTENNIPLEVRYCVISFVAYYYYLLHYAEISIRIYKSIATTMVMVYNMWLISTHTVSQF